MVTQIGLSPTDQLSQSSPTYIDQAIALLPLMIIIILIVIGIIFFIRWFFGKKELRKDIYTQDYKKTIEQCKICKNDKFIKPFMGFPSWFLGKGVPIVITYPNVSYAKGDPNIEYLKDDKKTKQDIKVIVSPGESYKLGTYAGHCVDMDGCKNYLVKSSKHKLFLFFPKLIVIKVREKHTQKTVEYNEDGSKTKLLEIPPDSYSESSDYIILNAFSIQKVGEYYYLVNRDAKGNIVDTKPFIYNDMIEIATQKQVMDIGRNLAAIAEDYIKTNPLVQFLRKTDTSLTGE